ncbi:MAG: D-alanyl-D-alanine carboxypeptidase family protein [Candidatus Gastranaerophilales bacterium]|nr:D-alanyl-D-alanine carboxypeptidase family protein [Candidatus Gastranaerophilales bacterium]
MNLKTALAALTVVASPVVSGTSRTMAKHAPEIEKTVVENTAKNDTIRTISEMVDADGKTWVVTNYSYPSVGGGRVSGSTRALKSTPETATPISNPIQRAVVEAVESPVSELSINPTNMNKVERGTLPADTKGIKMGGVTHYAYKDCLKSNQIVVDGRTVHKAIKEPYLAMKAAAKRDGVNLTIISGFRSIERQKAIFPRKWTSANRTESKFASRLRESAPPGFSEHHTGYAIDICSVEERDFMRGGKFEKEGQWLKEHASEYGFEQSFPENNSQGLICEPWHYRYVGSEDAQRTFKIARENQ